MLLARSCRRESSILSIAGRKWQRGKCYFPFALWLRIVEERLNSICQLAGTGKKEVKFHLSADIGSGRRKNSIQSVREKGNIPSFMWQETRL